MGAKLFLFFLFGQTQNHCLWGFLSSTDLPLCNFLLWSNWNSFPPSTFVSFLLFSLPSQPAAVIVCRCVLLKVFRQPHYSNCPAVTPPFTITSSCELWTRKHNHKDMKKKWMLETYWMHFFFFPRLISIQSARVTIKCQCETQHRQDHYLFSV